VWCVGKRAAQTLGLAPLTPSQSIERRVSVLMSLSVNPFVDGCRQEDRQLMIHSFFDPYTQYRYNIVRPLILHYSCRPCPFFLYFPHWSVCLSVCLSVRPSACLPACAAIRLLGCLSCFPTLLFTSALLDGWLCSVDR